MKMNCYCGATITDQTDDLPYKGHLIPDQEWSAVFKGMEQVIKALAAKPREVEAAQDRIGIILRAAVTKVYQCKACGRLFFCDDRRHQLHTFLPAFAETCREVFRSKG